MAPMSHGQIGNPFINSTEVDADGDVSELLVSLSGLEFLLIRQ